MEYVIFSFNILSIDIILIKPLLQMSYLISHNVKIYNIAEPFEAFQFACFLLRLKMRERELHRLFAQQEETFIAGLKSGSHVQWSMADTMSGMSANST